MANDNSLNKKYSKIYFATSLLHVAYVVIFWLTNCPILVGINLVSFCIYIALGFIAINIANIGYLFIACFWEIVLYTTLSSIIAGWHCGFMLYLIAILPLLFYSVYLFRSMENRHNINYCIGIVCIYFSVMFICFSNVMRVYYLPEIIENLCFTINVAGTFLIIISFLFVFFGKVKAERIELVQENSNLENTARYDVLTKLLNRRSFDEYMDINLKRVALGKNNFALLMCDLDDFKIINDTYGHECGDLVLINVAQALKNVLRERDHVFRWGGEEILILLTDDGENTLIVAERCRNAVENLHVFYNGEVVKTTITIGVCPYYPGATKDAMIKKADENMYIGKSNGKNQIVM